MKKVWRAIAVSIACGASTMAFAQALWESTQYGMSTSEVSQLIVDAKPASGGNRLFSGAKELLHIDDYTFADKEFEVSFFFVGDSLAQVMLSMKEQESNENNLRFFEAASAQFRTQYGQERTRVVSNRSSGLSAEAAWQSGQTEISLDVTPVTQDTSSININFRQNTAPSEQTRPKPASAAVPLTAGMDGEFAPLGTFVQVLNVASLGYVGRADRRKQLFHSGQMTSREMSSKNQLDLLLTGSGIFVLAWVARRIFRRKDHDA
jgi:hypothetical protein